MSIVPQALNLTDVVDMDDNRRPYEAKSAMEARELIFGGILTTMCTALGEYMNFVQSIENNLQVLEGNRPVTTPAVSSHLHAILTHTHTDLAYNTDLYYTVYVSHPYTHIAYNIDLYNTVCGSHPYTHIAYNTDLYYTVYVSHPYTHLAYNIDLYYTVYVSHPYTHLAYNIDLYNTVCGSHPFTHTCTLTSLTI